MANEPIWLAAARAKLGTREAPGTANSPTIMGWAKRLARPAPPPATPSSVSAADVKALIEAGKASAAAGRAIVSILSREA